MSLQERTMEAEERPSKLRKLSHTSAENESVDKPVPPHAQLEPTLSAKVENANNGEASVDTYTEHENSVANAAGLRDALNAQMDRTSDAEGQPAKPILSKNQLKKLRRKAEWEAGREDRKLKRKEKAKEKKARKRALRDEDAAEHNQDNTEEAGLQGDDIQKQPQKVGMPPRKRRQRLPIAFVIDCGFDKLMAEKEIISLGSQITRVYSDNSKAPFQAHLYVSGWTDESVLRKRFEGLLKSMYRNWKGTVFMAEDFVAAAVMAEQEMRGKNGGKMIGAFEKYAPAKAVQTNNVETSTSGQRTTDSRTEDALKELNEQTLNAIVAKTATEQPTNGITTNAHSSIADLEGAGEVIYLTSDSPYTLTELKPYHTYIIGGLVDKNRHKGICYKTALDKNSALASSVNDTPDPATGTSASAISSVRRKGIKTAKLPIGEYMSMTARHVLATNHVVEIMLRWLETRDWGQAFLSVMPKRKGAVLRGVKVDDDDEGDGDAIFEDKGEDQSDHAAQQEAAEAAALHGGSDSGEADGA